MTQENSDRPLSARDILAEESLGLTIFIKRLTRQYGKAPAADDALQDLWVFVLKKESALNRKYANNRGGLVRLFYSRIQGFASRTHGKEKNSSEMQSPTSLDDPDIPLEYFMARQLILVGTAEGAVFEGEVRNIIQSVPGVDIVMRMIDGESVLDICEEQKISPMELKDRLSVVRAKIQGLGISLVDLG